MEVDDVSNSFELTHDCLSKSGRTLTRQQRQGVWGLSAGALLTHSLLQKYKKYLLSRWKSTFPEKNQNKTKVFSFSSQ